MRALFVLLVCLFASVAHAGPAYQSSGKLYCAGENAPATVKYGFFEPSVAGRHEVVAAVSGKKIRVLSYVATGLAQVDFKFESNTTALTPFIRLGTASLPSALIYPMNCGQFGCFETAVGEPLNIQLSGNVSTRGHLTYIECS